MEVKNIDLSPYIEVKCKKHFSVYFFFNFTVLFEYYINILTSSFLIKNDVNKNQKEGWVGKNMDFSPCIDVG